MSTGKKRAALAFALGLTVVVVGGLLAAPARAAALPTVTTIDVSKNPAAAGQGVTITVRVSEVLFSPLGTVLLFDGPTLIAGPLVLLPDTGCVDIPVIGTVCGSPTDHSSVSTTRTFSAGTHVLTAEYLGGSDLPSPGGPLVLDVEPAVSDTAVRTSVDPSVHGQPVTFTASVSSTGEAPSGSVQFKIDGADAGAAESLDPSGHASIVASDLAVGSHSVSADFTSNNPDVQSSSGDLTYGTVFLPQIVKPADTSTTIVSSANPSEFGSSVSFTADVAVDAPGGGAPTGTVQFEDNGGDLGAPVPVDGSGHASIGTSALPVGSHTITAAYTSDSQNFNGSSTTLDQTVDRARTTLVYTGDTTADFHDAAMLSAQLVRTDNGAQVPGKAIVFAMASESCDDTTGANGDGSCSITPSEAAATYTVSVSFAGDGDYQASTAAEPFVVTKEETTIAYTGPTAILQGRPETLSAQLLEDGTTPIAGRTLTLTLGSGTSAESCTTAPTDSAGNASCSVAATIEQGPQPVRAEFAGDAYYLPSVDASRTAIVFAFPSRGAFVIGDRHSAAVTFWGAQWSSNNAPSGDSAPSSFKGFAGSPATQPPACGGTWSTEPGNSPSPVGSLPAYMGTLVTSSVRKSGSTISGNVESIVVVETAAGYAADPGHAGTGTVVATYC
jgi:Big-like domain-containing protein